LDTWALAFAVQQTSDTGYAIAGTVLDWLDYHVYLIKTDPAGDTLWTKAYFDGGIWSIAYSLQETSDGGYILAGGKGGNAYVVKTNPSGDFLWSRQYGGPNYEEAYCIDQTSDGGYIIAGAANLQATPNIYVVKTNANGDTLWTKVYGGSGSDVARFIQQTADGGYILAGASEGDLYLLKIGASGGMAWTKKYGGSAYEGAYSGQETTDLGYVFAGYTSSFGGGGNDFFVVRTNSVGDTLWARTFGSSGNDVPRSIRQTLDGGYVVAGYTDRFGTKDLYVVKLPPDSLMGCCVGIRGNVDGDPGDQCNVSDLTAMVDYLLRIPPIIPECLPEADFDGSGAINIADLTKLVFFLFRGDPPPPLCP
jgi:hypothetical protein